MCVLLVDLFVIIFDEVMVEVGSFGVMVFDCVVVEVVRGWIVFVVVY